MAVVTGGASGIGRAIAKGYAEHGAHVVILDANLGGAGEVGQEILNTGGEAWSFKLDVTDRQQCLHLAGQIEEKIGKISILVNNAGINRRNAFTSDPDTVRTDWDDIIEINLNGVFNVTHAFLEQLRATKGRVINIGSIQSFMHVRTPNSLAYTTSKHGVLGFTKALAIGPGLIETPLNENTRVNNPQLIQTFMDHTPLGRAGKPEDIVGPAVFLASDLAAYVTGGIVMADGGYRTI